MQMDIYQSLAGCDCDRFSTSRLVGVDQQYDCSVIV